MALSPPSPYSPKLPRPKLIVFSLAIGYRDSSQRLIFLPIIRTHASLLSIRVRFPVFQRRKSKYLSLLPLIQDIQVSFPPKLSRPHWLFSERAIKAQQTKFPFSLFEFLILLTSPTPALLSLESTRLSPPQPNLIHARSKQREPSCSIPNPIWAATSASCWLGWPSGL